MRRRFPNTPTKDLALLPTQMRNPHGIKTISEDLLAQWHRTWVNGLPLSKGICWFVRRPSVSTTTLT
ncbi:hypothetical protein ACWGLF_18500 [Streptomyces puniciscabiei]|uniref:hypothetical protein n=1 Tax=Streptomyces puniciscabiei TaxID=164348 RepID=UPI0037A33946